MSAAGVRDGGAVAHAPAGYLFGVLPARVREHHAPLRLPLLSLSFTDDEYLSERNIASLHASHAGAALDRRMASVH